MRAEKKPKLWGDGAHDDTAAINRLAADCAKRGVDCVIEGKTLLVLGTMRFMAGKAHRFEFKNCTFLLPPESYADMERMGRELGWW